MTTRAQMLAIVRETLADTTQWPDATLEAWIADAIRDYSHFFPYVVEKSYTFVAASRSFTISNLSPTPLEVLRVEYPDGEEPPRYLSRLSMTSDEFWDGPYYEVRGVPPNEIFMGEEAAIDDVVVVRYNAIHTIPSGGSSVLTIPDRHLEAIRLFCVWKAAEEIAMTEEIDPDTREFLVSQMGLNVIRCERIYRNKIQEYQNASLSERSGAWSMDGIDRIY
jgi:hypothetical protein